MKRARGRPGRFSTLINTKDTRTLRPLGFPLCPLSPCVLVLIAWRCGLSETLRLRLAAGPSRNPTFSFESRIGPIATRLRRSPGGRSRRTCSALTVRPCGSVITTWRRSNRASRQERDLRRRTRCRRSSLPRPDDPHRARRVPRTMASYTRAMPWLGCRQARASRRSFISSSSLRFVSSRPTG